MQTLENEKKIILRGQFIEIMDRLCDSLKYPNMGIGDFIDAYDSCATMCMENDEQFAYDYVVKRVIDLAPEMNNETYRKAITSLKRTTAYLQRFYIPNNKLPTVEEIGLANEYFNKE